MAEDSNKNKKHFFKDMKTELKKVNWLTPKQLLNNTTAVVVMVVIVFVLDLTFETMYETGVEGLKSIVQNDDNTISNTVNGETTGDETNTTNTVESDADTSSETENTVEANN